MGNKGMYMVIPVLVWYSAELTDKDKMLYGLMVSAYNNDGLCTLTNKQLAKEMKCTVRNVQMGLARLKECGYVSISQEPIRQIKLNVL